MENEPSLNSLLEKSLKKSQDALAELREVTPNLLKQPLWRWERELPVENPPPLENVLEATVKAAESAADLKEPLNKALAAAAPAAEKAPVVGEQAPALETLADRVKSHIADVARHVLAVKEEYDFSNRVGLIDLRTRLFYALEKINPPAVKLGAAGVAVIGLGALARQYGSSGGAHPGQTAGLQGPRTTEGGSGVQV